MWLKTFRSFAESLDPSEPLVLVAVVLTFVGSGFVSFPLNGLILITIVLFGPVYGSILSMTGALLNATALYWTGRWMGEKAVRNLMGDKITAVENFLEKTGSGTIFLLRLLPVTPFTIANLVCGAVRVPFRYYITGTFTGLLPGILILSLFGDRVLAFIQNPTLDNTYLFIVAVVLIPFTFFLIRVLIGYFQKDRTATTGK